MLNGREGGWEKAKACGTDDGQSSGDRLLSDGNDEMGNQERTNNEARSSDIEGLKGGLR